MPPTHGCPPVGLAYPEVTRAICLVPSASFSQAPWYALPVHLCRFRVRSICQSCFPTRSQSQSNPLSSDNSSRVSLLAGAGMFNPLPIGYGSRPRLRGRLTLRGLTLRRNPWTFGDRVSHSVCRYSCQHSHFRYLQRPSRVHLHRPTERSATAQSPAVGRQSPENAVSHQLPEPPDNIRRPTTDDQRPNLTTEDRRPITEPTSSACGLSPVTFSAQGFY